MKDKIFRAGLLPYMIETDGTVRFLLMKPADSRFGGDQFQMAKGKIEEGEETEHAALREAEEELGLITRNLKNLKFLGEYLGRTSVYMGEVRDPRLFNPPHFETSETIWMSLVEFQESGRSLHVHIIQDALRSIYLTTR